MSEVVPFTKDDQLFDAGKDGARHPRGCDCKPCVGRRSRRKGLDRQRRAKKALGIPSNRFHGQDGAEENWRGAVRVEVKSQGFVRPIVTKFLAAELQSEMNRSIGDPRPFMLVCMPDQWPADDGLVVFRIAEAREHPDAFSELLGGL